MSASFRQVFPYAGVDEHTATGNVGIVVPVKGSNYVLLKDGPELKVLPNNKAIRVEEIKAVDYHSVLGKIPHPTTEMELEKKVAALKNGAYRLFRVTGDSVPGLDVAKVEAKKAANSPTAIASLKVLVLRPRPVKVSIRPTQVLGSDKKPQNFMKPPFDAAALLAKMNAIWTAQANVVFSLGKSDPALIGGGLTPESTGADIKNPALLDSLKKQRDPDAGLTMFLVKQAYDGSDVVNGVTNSEAGVALISDSRSESTLAHEAGHYLGAVNEKGKFLNRYGHKGTDPELLMRDGGAGWKIPFGLVGDFNKGYTKS